MYIWNVPVEIEIFSKNYISSIASMRRRAISSKEAN